MTTNTPCWSGRSGYEARLLRGRSRATGKGRRGSVGPEPLIAASKLGRSEVFRSFVLAIASAMGFALAPASAYEGHHEQMVCSDVGMRETMVDVQAMQDGEKKTEAMNHMKMAEEAIAKHDMQGCMNHMQAAVEIMKK